MIELIEGPPAAVDLSVEDLDWLITRAEVAYSAGLHSDMLSDDLAEIGRIKRFLIDLRASTARRRVKVRRVSRMSKGVETTEHPAATWPTIAALCREKEGAL